MKKTFLALRVLLIGWAVLFCHFAALAQTAIDVGFSNFQLSNNVSSGNSDIMISVVNYTASSTLTKLTIEWSVDGQAQPTYHWTGSLAGLTASYAFSIGQVATSNPVTISVTLSAPNDGTDPSLTNNTWEKTFGPGLSGSYTIGGGGDFADITSAISYLNLNGVSGPVTFNIRDGVYHEQVMPDNFPGASKVNNVVFQSESHNAENVVITFDGFPPIILFSASHVTFKELSITGTNTGQLVAISGMSSYINITDNIIVAEGNVNNVISIAPQTNHLSIQDNRIEGGGRGIEVLGNAFYPKSVSIFNNHLIDNRYGGIYCEYISGGVLISNNTIFANQPDVLGYAAIYGAQLSWSHILSNRIDVYGTGINLSGNPNLVANNTIRIKDDETDNSNQLPAGIFYIGGFSRFFHNTIVTEDVSDQSAAVSGYFVEGELVNNIFANTGGGAVMRIEFGAEVVSHHNNFFGTGPHVKWWKGGNEWESFETVFDFSKAKGYEKRSVSVDPEFVIMPALHSESEKLIGAGDPLSFVTEDIDGNPRDPLRPSIGANEIGPLALHDLSVYEGAAMDLCSASSVPEVVIRNVGTETISTFKVKWSLNGAAEKTETWTGTLTGGDEVAYQLTGTYAFDDLQNISVEVLDPNDNTDERIFYNQLQTGFVKYSPVELGAEKDTLCFNGNSTVKLSPTKTFATYQWTGGATTSSIDISQNGQYYLTVKDLNNCQSSDNIEVKLVAIEPELKAQYGPEFCEGETKLLFVETKLDCSDCEYQWVRDDETIDNASESMYTTEVDGAFAVAVTSLGCTETESLDIVRHALPEKPVLTVSDKDICKGETATISAPLTGYTTLWWNPGWYPSYARTVETDTTGTWSITVSNGHCLIDSDPVTVTVHESPKFLMNLLGGQYGFEANTFCRRSDFVEMKANAIKNYGPLTYKWLKNEEVIDGAHGNTLYVNTPGSYSVEVSTQFCSTLLAIPLQIFNTPPKPVLEQPNAICKGTFAEIAAPSGYDAYRWSNGSTSKVIKAYASGEYSVRVTSWPCESEMSDPIHVTVNELPDPVVSEDDGVLHASGGDSYQWFKSGQIISGATSSSYEPTVSGSYSVAATQNNCTAMSAPISFTFTITGVESALSNIEVYPNPAKNELHINLHEYQVEAANITIHNFLGQCESATTERTKDGVTLHISHLSPGIYFLNLKTGIHQITRRFSVR